MFARNQPEGDPTDKTIVRPRVAPPGESLDRTQIHRRVPAAGPPGPPPPTRPGGGGPSGGGPAGGGPPQGPPKRKGGLGGLRRDQIRYLIVAWFGFTLIVGVCAFAGIYALSTGDGFRSTDATPIGALPTITQVPTLDPGTVIPTLLPTDDVQPAPTLDTGGGGLPPIQRFNLGGQSIHGGFPGAGDMQRANMTWVKLQAWDLTIDFGPAIENAHNLGFRILITVVDKPNKDLVMMPDYQQRYADYVVNVAAQGADAIEIWNEENIDREWPAGQISGAAYARLLEFVYPKIKAANPDTIVISGAPSPTGFFGGGCSAAGCDDRPYLRDMVSAGALNYADCVGIHYNEGILSPLQTSGDPRGNSNHYTRYYQTMVNTYLEATGRLKPLCFTELGYLSAEGYPPLSSVAPSFAWASQTTAAQQAQWLAEAATLARDSDGDVLLLIVFNVDFVEYGADPQAGYAIIRPDGSCPACDTLAAVMR